MDALMNLSLNLSALQLGGTRTYKAFVEEAIRFCISAPETRIWPIGAEVLALALRNCLTVSK